MLKTVHWTVDYGCHRRRNPQFVSVLGYECLTSTENIGRRGPSRASAPLWALLLSFHLNMPPRELSGNSELVAAGSIPHRGNLAMNT